MMALAPDDHNQYTNCIDAGTTSTRPSSRCQHAVWERQPHWWPSITTGNRYTLATVHCRPSAAVISC